MKNLLIILILLMAVGGGSNGCALAPYSYKNMLTDNRRNIQNLSLGMNKMQVVRIMGTKAAPTPNGEVPNPAKTEAFIKGKDKFEVMLYMTIKYHPFTRINDNQATPVVLKNGKVIGWGWDVVKRARQIN